MHEAIAAIIPFTTKSTVYQDLTGCFPHKSSRGTKYIIIVYDHDSNWCILRHAIKDRAGMTIKTAWEDEQLTLVKRGCATKLWIFDNDCSKELKAALLKYGSDFQRVPPHIHCRNVAEQVIRTF